MTRTEHMVLNTHGPITHFPFGQGSTHVHASAILVGFKPAEQVSQDTCPMLLWYFCAPATVQETHTVCASWLLYLPAMHCLHSELTGEERGGALY